MLRKLRVFFVLGLGSVSLPAAAAEPNDSATSTDAASPPLAAPAPPADVKPPQQQDSPWYRDWQTSISGYFRAPMALGISSRGSPEDPTTPARTQVTYAPYRTIDSSPFAFTYTRLQEQDWAELFVHEKHKHVEAVLGMMGYWLGGAAGFRNPDAAMFPGIAYLTLDTDFALAGIKPNIALTMGAWWPKFGYFEKYDTYTLGRFRQMGEQLALTVPVTPQATLVVTSGFGTPRDGAFTYSTGNPLYNSQIGLDLVTYENIQFTYDKFLDVGLHYNNEWTANPYLLNGSASGNKAYTAAEQAHLSVVGMMANVSAPYAGRLWVSPSYINVKNGWALNGDGGCGSGGGNGGTEVMHSLGGCGVATNYLGWSNAAASNTGSGSMLNFGFLYENSLSVLMGKPKHAMMPDVTLNVFGLLADATLDLPAGPAGSPAAQNSLKQFKYGADVTVQPLDWFAFVLRYDTVNLDLDHPAYVYNVITPRLVFFTHILSGESIYLQYSRYTYGDKMLLGAASGGPLGTPLVPGYSDVLQNSQYVGQKPDMDVVKLQATMAF